MLVDIADQEIKVGSWIAQAYSLGRCPALKLSYVTAIKDKKVQVRGFERHNSWWDTQTPGERLTEPEITWERNTSRYSLAFPERMVVITTLPATLLKYIEEVFDGNPDATEGVKI